MIYLGRVRSIDDPLFKGRIKVEIADVTDGLEIADLMWCYPKKQDFANELRVAKEDEIVLIEFFNGDKYNPMYSFFHTLSDSAIEILKESYEGAKIVYHDEELQTSIFYTQEKGLFIDNQGSIIQIRKDKSIFIAENEGKSIHLNEGNISIGKETKSDESAVLGESNESVLNLITETFGELSNILDTGLKQLSTVAKGNPHTMPLSTPLESLANNLKSMLEEKTNQLKNDIPETKSKVVTIDKE